MSKEPQTPGLDAALAGQDNPPAGTTDTSVTPSPSAQLSTIDLTAWNGLNISNHVPGTFKFRLGQQIVTDPPHRKIRFINELSVRRGLYVNWQNYTPDQYLADTIAYPGFSFVVPPEINGDRLYVKGHWAVWVPMELWQRQQQAQATQRKLLLGHDFLPESRPGLVDVTGYGVAGKPGEKTRREIVGG